MGLYRFLGSVHFAVFLITVSTLFVIAGTFIEAATGSHQQAAFFTYGNPFFTTILWGFFINILVSALHRWPFRIFHIPFLITHLGLLMILAGALLKGLFGLQGNLSVMEGSGSHLVLIPSTYALHIEQRDPKKIVVIPLKENVQEPFPEFKVQLSMMLPHAQEILASWIKGPLGFINGLQPFPAQDWKTEVPFISASTRIKFPSHPEIVWEVFAGNVENMEKTVEQIYLHNVDFVITDAQNKTMLFKKNLTEVLEHEISWENGKGDLKLHLNFSKFSGFEDPELRLDYISEGKYFAISVPLHGSNSLINHNVLSPHLGSAPINVQLKRKNPAIVLLRGNEGDQNVFFLGMHGQLFLEHFPSSKPPVMFMYDQGYGGYSTQMNLPIKACLQDCSTKEQALLAILTTKIKAELKNEKALSPPLTLWKKACESSHTEFSESIAEFLWQWHLAHGWLYPENSVIPEKLVQVFQSMDWKKVSEEHKKGCCWVDCFFATALEPQLEKGENVADILQCIGWPFEVVAGQESEILTTCTQQIFSSAQSLPNIPEHIFGNSIVQNARFFSAYLRAYGVHLSNIFQNNRFIIEEDQEEITLECPVTTEHTPTSSNQKLEDNTPLVTVAFEKAGKKEFIRLLYDRYGAGLKWPILNGSYLMRFQPSIKEIPYHVRLRQARQINYPHSQQSYSYESDLIFTDLRNGHSVEKTISMNNVHETSDGYRFYLANISPSDPGAVKRVQLVVNHDPAKYWLTYPGALLLSLGVILLFWFNDYFNTSKR